MSILLKCKNAIKTYIYAFLAETIFRKLSLNLYDLVHISVLAIVATEPSTEEAY